MVFQILSSKARDSPRLRRRKALNSSQVSGTLVSPAFLALCCCQRNKARFRRKMAAKGTRFGLLALAVAKWSSHCWMKLSHSMWIFPQYSSRNLAFRGFLRGPSGKTSGWGAGVGARGLASRTVLKIRWRSAFEYLTVALASTGARVSGKAGKGAGARVGVRDTAGTGV